MNITILGYDINLEIVALCVLLYFLIVFNIIYSTLKMQGLKDLYELLGISVEEGFEVLKQTTIKLKQIKNEKIQQKIKEEMKNATPKK